MPYMRDRRMRKIAATGFTTLSALNGARCAFFVLGLWIEFGVRLGVKLGVDGRSMLVGVDLGRLCCDVVN